MIRRERIYPISIPISKVMSRLAWGVTGGGQYLEDCLEVIVRLSKEMSVTTMVSAAGQEVLQMYGLFEQLSLVSPGGYLRELILEKDMGPSYPITGRFMLQRYDLLLVAPATSNTVAKIVRGIADTLITNAVSLANKSGVPVYILPTDVREDTPSSTPYSLDRTICSTCTEDICPPREACPEGAISDQIDLSLCRGCGQCVTLCPMGAIRPLEIQVRPRRIDRKNIQRLRSMEGIEVLSGPLDIYELKNLC